jgi:hypothetical protein
MRILGLTASAAIVMVCAASATGAPGQYPLTLDVDAQMKTDTTTVTSKLTIRVERLMDESLRMQGAGALKYGGYPNFLNMLRTFPAVGTIELSTRKVNLRYAHEQETGEERRLVLVSDNPLVFLSGDPQKIRAGYELTVVELRFDAQGGITGTMAGAARVKPSPDGGVVLDDFAQAPAQLTAHARQPDGEL